MNYGRYKIVSELGRGAMGMVYQAHDPQIDRMVALKVLREDRLTTEDFVQRFLKEATAIGRLSHPGIVTVYDVGQDHGTIYIAMEFLEGQSLDQVAKQGNLNIQDIVAIGIQVAQALQYAHKKGIVHRDIKPANIIYTPEMTIKVTDFGIAHIDDPDGQQMTRAGEILGTPIYMAPEQVLGQTVDGRSDLYSLGVILYELTTGRRPFQGDNLAAIFRAITNDEPVPPSQINSAVPPALSSLILKAMAKKPEDRFSSGQEFADLLVTCLNNQPVDSFTETVIQKVPQKKRINLGLTLPAIFLLCGAGLIFYFYLLPQKGDKEQRTITTSQIKEQEQESSIPAEEALPPTPLVPAQESPPPAITITTSDKTDKQSPNLPPEPPPNSTSTTFSATQKVENTFLKQQAADSIEELFTEEKGGKAAADISTSTFSSELKPPDAVTKMEQRTKITPLIAPQTSAKEKIISLLPKDKKQQTDLHQKTAVLSINSNPSGASLYIDGDYQGVTPIEVETTAIKHEVKLELQGHLGWQAQLNLSKGGKIPLSIPLLKE